MFTDEKIFTIEQSFNSQNDRIWAESSPGEDVIVTRIQKPVSIMVWGGISATSKTPLLFLEKGVKMNQNTYREILENSVLPWAKTQIMTGYFSKIQRHHIQRNLFKSGYSKIFQILSLQKNGYHIHQI